GRCIGTLRAAAEGIACTQAWRPSIRPALCRRVTAHAPRTGLGYERAGQLRTVRPPPRACLRVGRMGAPGRPRLTSHVQDVEWRVPERWQGAKGLSAGPADGLREGLRLLRVLVSGQIVPVPPCARRTATRRRAGMTRPWPNATAHCEFSKVQM